MKTILPPILLSLLAGILLVACGGGGSASTPVPATTGAPSVAPTPTEAPPSAPTEVSQPAPTRTAQSADAAANGFVDLEGCLEDRLGPEITQELVSGTREETSDEAAVLEGCLQSASSGISPEDLTAEASACLEEQLGAGVIEMVGSGARPLTAAEELILLDCVVSGALGETAEEPVSSLEACLENLFGAEIAPLVASRSVPLNDEETTALNQCRLETALGGPEQTTDAQVIDCVAEQLGEDLAALVVSGAVPLSEAEEAVLAGCRVGASLGAAVEPTGQAMDSAVTACLEDSLGADVAAVVASGAVPLNQAEEELLGECLLSASLETSAQETSLAVTACLGEQLGPEIAAVVASGAFPLSEEEERIMGDCVLQEALGTSP